VKDKHVDAVGFGNSEGNYFNKRKKCQDQYVLCLDSEATFDKITYVRLESNTCVNFLSSSKEDQSNIFLILNGIQCEYLAEMIIDLSHIEECVGAASSEE
jgi:hypothetical protein